MHCANFSEITLISIGVVIRDRTAGNTSGIVCPHIHSHTCTNAHSQAHMQTHIHEHMHTYKHTSHVAICKNGKGRTGFSRPRMSGAASMYALLLRDWWEKEPWYVICCIMDGRVG